jgi:hypothetical protein
MNTYDIYKRQRGLGTRHGTKYDRISTEGGPHPGTHFTSVTMCSDICAVMHLCTPRPTPSIVPLTFIAMLATFGNSSLWDNLSVDGDGEWIRAGIEMGTLCIAHDRSYMAEEATNLCSAVVVIFCQRSRQWLKVSIAELPDAVSNYHRKLLGAVKSLLILHAASVGIVPPIPTTILYYSNRGVISHSNSPLTALPKNRNRLISSG